MFYTHYEDLAITRSAVFFKVSPPLQPPPPLKNSLLNSEVLEKSKEVESRLPKLLFCCKSKDDKIPEEIVYNSFLKP